MYKVSGCTQVISALAESSTVARSSSEPPLHIPYRDSKLTKLLMDSLVSAMLLSAPIAIHMQSLA